MNRFAFNTEGKICDYGCEEPKVLTEQDILEELNHLENTKNEFMSECQIVNYRNECLQEELDKAIVPKFKYHQIVYVLCNTDIIKGQIDCFDYYNKKYLIYTMEFGLGNEWCYEHELFATEEEARAKLRKLQNK